MEWEKSSFLFSFYSLTQLDTCSRPGLVRVLGAARCFLFSLIPNTRFYWSTRLVLWPLNYWTWWAGGKNIKCLSRKILISAVCCLIDKICWETFIGHFSRAAALQAVRDVRPQSELQPCSERREASVFAAALQLCCSSASQEVTPPPSPSSLISI